LIAADSSSLIAFLTGEEGGDVQQIIAAVTQGLLCLPPVVLTEVLSDSKTHNLLEHKLAPCPLLDILPGYWQRAGASRAVLIKNALRAKIPDVLIAQSCIDHDVALIARDADFRHFAKHCGLKLA
jgi:predicted nucleic acid-binding protein